MSAATDALSPWSELVLCGACDARGLHQPLVPSRGVLCCPACLAAGRTRVTATEPQLIDAWSRALRTLQFDRFALGRVEKLLRDQLLGRDTASIVASTRESVRDSDPHDRVELLRQLAASATWDGGRLQVRWRQPFDLLVDAAVSLGASTGDRDLDDVVARWAELAGERLAEVLAHVLAAERQDPEPAPAARDDEPITTWRGVARVLGKSEDTIGRHRTQYHDRLKTPWFRDAEEVRTWWRELHEPPRLRRAR